jgi:hypothetical protein
MLMHLLFANSKNKPEILAASNDIEKSIWIAEINKAKSEWALNNSLASSGTIVRRV